MLTRILLPVAALSLGGLAHGGPTAAPMVLSFERDAPGRPPRSFAFEVTGKGPAVKWEVRKDPTAPSGPNVLAQLGRAEGGDNFPLAVFDGTLLRGGDLSVRLKGVAGEEDRAGGLLWRYKDRNNYYIVRANALEDNVVLYRVKNGKRRPIAPIGKPLSYGVKAKVPSAAWHALRVTFEGSRFVVYFNGERLFEAEDSALGEPGRVGLWTKADSVTFFDDLAIGPLEKDPAR